tara:strand:- start:907 stop:1518 length:612 start_codon:yes stop_codon:yes gene_type:complete
MALTDKEYEKFYKETGSGSDKIAAANKAYAKTAFEYSATHGFSDIIDDYRLGPIIYMMQQMQDELDYLRTEISTNKDKATFPGLGTSNSTALAGDTTTISTAQASAITANTAKVSMVIGTGKGEAMPGQTNLVTVGTQAHQAMAGNTTIPPISITGLPANHTFDVQVRVMPPAKGAKKGTAVLTWAITDVPNRVVYSSNQTLI